MTYRVLLNGDEVTEPIWEIDALNGYVVVERGGKMVRLMGAVAIEDLPEPSAAP